MNEDNGLVRFVDDLNNRILPNIDFNKLQLSYDTNMAYAKGVLNLLHETMIKSYGSQVLHDEIGEDGFVLIPGIVRGKESGSMCIALLELDLSSSGEHWATSYLTQYGVISQSGGARDDDTLKAIVQELNNAYVPYDYCYTATIPCDIHVQHSSLPKELTSVIEDFRNHKELLPSAEKVSVVDRLKASGKEQDSPGNHKKKAGKSEPTL